MASIRFLVKPGCRKNEIKLIDNGQYQLRIAAPATDGKANAEIQRYLASIFKIPKSCIEIQKGETSRFKTILLPMDADTLLSILKDVIG